MKKLKFSVIPLFSLTMLNPCLGPKCSDSRVYFFFFFFLPYTMVPEDSDISKILYDCT